MWHPWGCVWTWSLERWLSDNVWESEDGPTRKRLVDRSYFWDGPLCWIDDATVAIWGWGHDDEWLVPAVQIFDVQSGKRLSYFAGPKTTLPRNSPSSMFAQALYFDKYIFAVDDKSGTTVWDVASGERLHHDPALLLVNYHPTSKEFLSIDSDGIKLSRLVE